MRASLAVVLPLLVSAGLLRADDGQESKKVEAPRRPALERGVAALRAAQSEDGHWECREYPTAATAMGGLALLGGQADPLSDPATRKALRWLLGRVKDGRVEQEGHTWIHVQGFTTLCLAEAWARAQRMEKAPDLREVSGDVAALGSVVLACARAIEAAQSPSGGWWYQPDGTDRHEGSTTVCAVQALRAARNAGVQVKREVLEKGFEYLKRTQNADGSFQYQLGRTDGMVAGTAGGVATLALMDKLDYEVMFKGAKRLVTWGPEHVAGCDFPEYGQLYALLGMKLVFEDMGESVQGTGAFLDRAEKLLLDAQLADGAWESRGWIGAGQRSYATALAVMTLAVREERLTIYRRAG